MTIPAVPASLSLYRGQSRTGIGEGPGDPVSRGEQYLAADPPLAGDGPLLAAVRPWFSLDMDPEDSQRLGERLEGWSCMVRCGQLFVVHLSAAGTYGGRAAYFAHGRAWPLASLPPGCDPGLYVGRADAFDAPWRDGARAAPSPLPEPLLQTAPIASEPDVAARLLAHLFQALVRKRPLIVAVPVEELGAGSPLHALLAFSRAGLPADLRQACSLRIHTRLPDVFLQQGASLVAVPEPAAGAAMRASRDAVLVDRRGDVKAGAPPAAPAIAYAEAVVERALHLPQGLAWFAERYARHRAAPGLPDDGDVRTVQLTYNLAFTFAAPETRGDDLVRRYLPLVARGVGAGVAWERLIDAGEWRRLPVAALRALVLRSAAAAAAGERHLVAAAAAALGRLGESLDGDLDGWWETAGSSRLASLLAILALSPRLISPPRAAGLTSRVAIDEIGAAGSPHGVLDAELAAGVIGRREGESAALARWARDAQHGARVFAVLARATAQGALAADWAASFVRAATGTELAAAAERLLPAPRFWEAFDGVPKLLLDRLHDLGPPPAALCPVLAAAAGQIDPIARLDLYVRLLDLLGAAAPGAAEPLRERLRQALGRLDDREARGYLVRVALDGGWSSLDLGFLVRPDGELALPWVEGVADLLLASPAAVAALATSALLRVAGAAESDAASWACLAEIDRRAEARLEETTEALIREGWWHLWSRGGGRRGDPPPGTRRQRALAFLGCAAWTRQQPPEALRESWLVAVADLLEGELSGTEMRHLCGTGAGGRRWPWIPAFQREQLQDLAAVARDLGALAELAAAAAAEEQAQDLGPAIPALLLAGATAGLAAELPPDALRWLLEPPPTPALGLAASKALWDRAGHLRGRALAVRVRSVAAQLAVDPELAVEAADDPDLWDDEEFLDALAVWMTGPMTVQGREGPDRALCQWIDARVGRAPSRRLAPVPVELVRRLLDMGCGHAADFLVAGARQQAGWERQGRAVLAALIAGESAGACWDDLQAAVAERRGAADRRHPLSLLAEQIRGGGWLTPAQRAALRSRGWPAFAAALSRYPSLLAAALNEPVLPALDLAASLTAGGTLGGIAMGIAEAAAGTGCRSQRDWWRALLCGLPDCRRQGSLRSAEDREDVALALLEPLRRTLRDGELGAFSQAIQERLDELAGAGSAGTRSEKTMSETVTFFRHRQDEGGTYELAAGPRDEPSLVIYSRLPLDPAVLGGLETQDPEGGAARLKSLRMLISSHGDGGLIVSVAARKDRRTVKIDVISRGGDHDPAQLWVLPAARPPCPQAIDGRQITLDAGAHLLVPVDADAAAHLQRFIQGLEWLSPDLQALVLTSIRQPSLEARLTRLEDAAASRERAGEASRWQAGAAAARPGRLTALLRRCWAHRQEMGSALTILLLAALAVNAYLVQRPPAAAASAPAVASQAPGSASVSARGGSAAAPSTTSTASPGSAHGADGSAPPVAAREERAEVAAAVRSLLEAVKSRHNAGRRLGLLYDSSFKDYERDPKSGAAAGTDVTRLFSAASRPFLWGLIKLQALKLRPGADPSFLSSAESISATKRVFRGIRQADLAADPDGLELLVVAACRLGYKPLAPALPPTNRDQDPPVVLLAGADCAAYGPDRSVPGLVALTAFVRGYQEPKP